MNTSGPGLKITLYTAVAITLPAMGVAALLVVFREGMSLPLALGLAACASLAASACACYIFIRPALRRLAELERTAAMYAQGDFSPRIEAGRGCLEHLAGELNRIADCAVGAAAKTRSSAGKIMYTGEDVSARCRDVAQSSASQAEAVETASQALTRLNMSIRLVAEGIADVKDLAAESSASVRLLSDSTHEISRSAQSLSEAIVDDTSSTDSMAISIMETADGIDSLAKVAATAKADLDGIKRSLGAVEEHTKRSVDLSELVGADADYGMQAVQMTIEGMERIRLVVQDASDVVRKLGRSSREIDDIIKVISEVTEQTNLLSLNAAIIATQAGEQGRSFGVVADAIKGLAERTGRSTKEIVKIIKSVQKEAAEAVESMEAGYARVEEGVALSGRAGEALGKIIESAMRSREVAGEIAAATSKHVDGVLGLGRSMESIAEMAGHIAVSTQGQSRAAEGVIKAASEIKALSMKLRKATDEQAGESARISRAVEDVSRMTLEMYHAVAEQVTEKAQIMKLVGTVRDKTLENAEAVSRIGDGVGVMKDEAAALHKKGV